MKIAVSGKGGVGKTTFSALLIKTLAGEGKVVTAIDADPDANLAFALGFSEEVKITPLVEMDELIKERVGAEPGKPAVYFTMNPKVDDIPDRFSEKKDNIRLMAMGTIRRGGSGCACPENVIVRQLLSHLLVQPEEMVVLDMEAGIEHLGRGTTQFVDLMIVVVEPGVSSFQTYFRIKKLAEDLKMKKVAVVANKVRNAEDVQRIREGLGCEVWGVIPLSENLIDYHGVEVTEQINEEIAKVIELTRKEIAK